MTLILPNQEDLAYHSLNNHFPRCMIGGHRGYSFVFFEKRGVGLSERK